MRPPTPLAPSALSPAAIDTVAAQGLPAPEMWGADSEPRTQSRSGLPLRPPPEPHHQPRRRQRRRRLPFHPPSSHGPAARRQPSHVTWPGHAPGRPRAMTHNLATPAPAGCRHWGGGGGRDVPSVCGLPDGGPAHSLTTGRRGSCPSQLLQSLYSHGSTSRHACRDHLKYEEDDPGAAIGRRALEGK